MTDEFRDYLAKAYPHVLALYPEVVYAGVYAANRGPFDRKSCNYTRFQEVWVRQTAYSPLKWAGKKVLVVAHGYTINKHWHNYYYAVVGLEAPVLGVVRRFQNQYLTDIPVLQRSFNTREQQLVDLLKQLGFSAERAALQVYTLGGSFEPNDSTLVNRQTALERVLQLPDFQKVTGNCVFYDALRVRVYKPSPFTVVVYSGDASCDFTLKITLETRRQVDSEALSAWLAKLLRDPGIELELPNLPSYYAISDRYGLGLSRSGQALVRLGSV